MDRHIIRFHAENARTGEVMPGTDGVISDRGLENFIRFVKAFRAIVPTASLKESVDFKDDFVEVFEKFANHNRMATIAQIRADVTFLTQADLDAMASLINARKHAYQPVEELD